MGLWSSLFLEFWKRKEKYTALQWGMIGFEEEEQTRPRFEGEIIKSSITGRPTKYFPRLERSRRTLVSSAIIAGLILLVIGVLACIFSLRIAMQKANFIVAGVEMASIVASILIAIQIQVYNIVLEQAPHLVNR